MNACCLKSLIALGLTFTGLSSVSDRVCWPDRGAMKKRSCAGGVHTHLALCWPKEGFAGCVETGEVEHYMSQSVAVESERSWPRAKTNHPSRPRNRNLISRRARASPTIGRAAKRANFRNFRPALSCGIVKVFLGEADLLSFMAGSCGTSHRAVTGLHLRDRRPVRELSAFRLSGNFSTVSSVVVRGHLGGDENG